MWKGVYTRFDRKRKQVHAGKCDCREEVGARSPLFAVAAAFSKITMHDKGGGRVARLARHWIAVNRRFIAPSGTNAMATRLGAVPPPAFV